MAVVGIGVDIIQVKRMQRLWQGYQLRLLKRILHPQERAQLPTDTAQIARWLAKRWAVKEAAAKALGTGFRMGIRWHDFIYTHDPLGKPQLQLFGKAAELASAQHHRWHVSLTDEKAYIVAMVIAECHK